MFPLLDTPTHHSSAATWVDSIATPQTANTSRSRRSLPQLAQLAKASNTYLTSTVLHLRDGLTSDQRLAAQHRAENIHLVTQRLRDATRVEEWRAAARELDILEGNEAWKTDNESSEFDAPLIQARLDLLNEARASGDVRRMLYLHSHVGTKDLIESYIDATIETIQKLARTDERALPAGLETKDIMEQVVLARQAFGRSALLLSGGATLGMYHIGVLKALFEEKLLPRIISGASAGSIVCSVLCTRTDEEIPEVLRGFPHGNLAVFEEQDREEGALEHVARLLTQGAWIDIKHLTQVMQELLGDMTFQEAYNRTRRILNICVSPSSIYELPRLLNYITSPNVLIWSAVAASCSVPFVFSSAHILAKNPVTGEHSPWNPTPLRWIDGSVDNDLPMTSLAEMFNVNHFIVSQVNPHIVPFLSSSAPSLSQPSAFKLNSHLAPVLAPLTRLAKSEALHRLHVLAQLGVLPNICNKARNMLSQKYSGDITILPRVEYRDFVSILKNPSPGFMVRACEAGERATWPLLGRTWSKSYGMSMFTEQDTQPRALSYSITYACSAEY
ncbi:Lipase 5 [Pseudogymnoascus australis]